MEYEDFSISEDEIIEAQQMPEPTLDNDVLEIFQEFKKGLEDQIEDEDSETHYNLGIAYKEMGLVDDAIKEFQTAQKDKKSFLQSSSMLGVCYMEKGLYSLAIDVLNKTLKSIKEHSESSWSIKYDLAEAYEKNNNPKESLDLYTEVYGWNAKFRNVSEKVNLLKTQTAKAVGNDKTKGRKDRVSYL
jgi:tetratricopeptide (TPR) repeat protein